MLAPGDSGLAYFLDRLNWSPERLAREINRLCGAGTVSAKAPYHWLKGAYPRRGVPEAVVEVLSQHLDEPVDLGRIWPRAAGEERRASALLRDSHTSAQLVQQVSETNADDATLAQLARELDNIVGYYSHMPSSSLVERVALLRDRVAQLLRGNQKPVQRRELLSLGAKLCTMLAWMSDDLGDSGAAYIQASAAWDLADLADDNEARRWARVAQAKQAYWLGHFAESAQHAVDGASWPAPDGLDVLLRLGAARAWAASGMADEARRALKDWADRSDEGSAPGGGLFSFRHDRQSYLAGHTLLSLDEPAWALRELGRSLEWVERLPATQRFQAVEVLIRIDVLRAQLRLKDVEAMTDVVSPLFELEPHRMVNMVVVSLRQAAAELRRRQVKHRRLRDLARRLDDLGATAAPDRWDSVPALLPRTG
ncbi:hypothetical protein EDD40_0031 [Saccharothrix texasensis]|uniref:XRE family transcriptional regulator n=1 Tax=Saccharothrix texasensis TaxID=103734 RepID=A0A3N1GX81_9PSEU|nr:hypothetical protein EDD40_0031 [Saccharothrix texasensis]